MDAIILDNLPFHLDVPQLLERLHVRPESREAGQVRRMAGEAQAIGRPKAIYRIGYIESRGSDHVIVDGLKLTSRVLRVNLENAQRVFAHVCTAGRELEAWVQAQADMFDRYWADAINETVLYAARMTFRDHLKQRYALVQTAEMHPGSLEDWPLREQRVLFAMLGDTRGSIGVELTSSLLMVPTKTVSGLLFPTEETFASCQLCAREACPNRRARYDPDLFDRKYGASTTLEP